MPIDHFTPLFHSTTISNNHSPKVRVDSPVVEVEYTTACSTKSWNDKAAISLVNIPLDFAVV